MGKYYKSNSSHKENRQVCKKLMQNGATKFIKIVTFSKYLLFWHKLKRLSDDTKESKKWIILLMKL